MPSTSDIMNRTGKFQQRTTYLISLTLVKVETTGEDRQDGVGQPRQRPEAQCREAAEGPMGGPKHNDAFADLETGKSGNLNTGGGEGLRLSPRGNEPIPTAEAHWGDGRKSITSPATAETGTVRRAGEELQRATAINVRGAVCSAVKSDVPVQVSRRPVSLLRANSSALSGRELKQVRDSEKVFSRSLDRREDRTGGLTPTSPKPGPFRASWAVSEAGPRAHVSEGEVGSTGGQEGDFTARKGRSGRTGRMPAASASLPTPLSVVSKPMRKGKSHTLDNSDLSVTQEDLPLGQEGWKGRPGAQNAKTGHCQTGSVRDRKMLKFISGIFSKSSSAAADAAGGGARRPGQQDTNHGEASCANSQEWTLSRSIPELRLGVLGSFQSEKSALLNRYITGLYRQVKLQEGGRYKKEVLVDGQSHLLLIREESGLPTAQFSNWVDAVILVFSLENEASFQEVYKLFSELCTHRNTADIPLIIVGTQDKITSTNPRVIEDKRVHQLCADMRRCVYYETCATYGLHVDRVFTEVTQRIVALKRQAAQAIPFKSLPNSPSHSGATTPVSGSLCGQASNGGQSSDYSSSLPSTPVIGHREFRGGAAGEGGSQRNIPKRRTSLFTSRRGSDTEKRSVDRGDQGSSRPTVIKQGTLLKRSGSSLNKEWKKKFVTLSSNGTLSYHSNNTDYKQNAHGKEMDLLRVTVKVPGKRLHRAVTTAGTGTGINGLAKERPSSEGTSTSNLLPVDEREGSGSVFPGDQRVKRCPSTVSSKAQSIDSSTEVATSPPPGKELKSRRKKSMNQKGDATIGHAEAKRKMWKLKSFGSLRNIYKTEDENADFIIISSSGQSWHFEAPSHEERDAWVHAIESQILACLQCCESRNKARRNSQSEAVALQAIRNTKGNDICVDCGAPNPTWASLNLGALICIECSGIHRNLGTHLSRVRSLDLDDWPSELTQVLLAIGNTMANTIWEGCVQGQHKPAPEATREARESWIRAKYEQRAFVAPLPAQCESPGNGMSSSLLSAVTERNLPRLLLLLAHSSKEQINVPPAGAHPKHHNALHAACQLGDVVMTQLQIWYGSDVKAKDSLGQTALTLARQAGSKECVEILRQHGCPSDIAPALPTPVLSRKSSITSLGRVNSRRRIS